MIILKSGYRFRYRNQFWKVRETYIISWDDQTKTYEYKVKSEGGEIGYLEIEVDANGENPIYSFWKDETNKDFLFEKYPEEDVIYIEKASFPKKINFEGELFEFDERNDGICDYGYETEKVNCLSYTNANDTKFLALEFWDDEIELSTGIPISEHDISAIEEGKLEFSGGPFLYWIGRNIVGIVIGFFLIVMFSIQRCTTSSTTNSQNNYSQNDSTKTKSNRVNRSSSGYYRSRNSRGSGK